MPDRSQLEPLTRQMAAAGRAPRARAPARRAAGQARRRRPRGSSALWDEVDVLMTPGLAKTAIAAEGGYGKAAPLAIDIAGRFTPYTPMFNLTGQPAIDAPGGLRQPTGCR